MTGVMRRFALTALLMAAHVAPVAAQPTTTDPFHIFAVLWRGETDVEDGFREYLQQRGIPFELTIRNLNLDRANAPPIVEEIRQVKPDLVYTWGTGTTSSILGKIGADTFNDIPGVFTLVAYPQAAEIVESFETPGRAVTGVAFLPPIEAQLNTIKAYRPFETIAVIYDATAGNSRLNVAELRETAPALDLNLIELPVPPGADGRPDPSTLPALVAQAKAEGAEVLYMGPDSFLTRHAQAYTAAAIAAGLPTFASTQAPLKSSRAMFGLVTDYHTLGKLTGLQAERILIEGRAPADIPVARLARYKLWINVDVVREIGMYPPMNMIGIADFTTSVGAQ